MTTMLHRFLHLASNPTRITYAKRQEIENLVNDLYSIIKYEDEMPKDEAKKLAKAALKAARIFVGLSQENCKKAIDLALAAYELFGSEDVWGEMTLILELEAKQDCNLEDKYEPLDEDVAYRMELETKYGKETAEYIIQNDLVF